MDNDDLERDLRLVYGAYEYLRAHDLAGRSTTSRLLRAGDLVYLAGRSSDELRELEGTVAGTHGHRGGRDDIVLEAYQSLYWLMLLAVAAGDRYDDLRPHVPLTRADVHAALSLRDDAAVQDAGTRRELRAHGFARVGAACRHAGVPVEEAVRRDLRELRAKGYLDPYWGQADGPVAPL